MYTSGLAVLANDRKCTHCFGTVRMLVFSTVSIGLIALPFCFRKLCSTCCTLSTPDKSWTSIIQRTNWAEEQQRLYMAKPQCPPTSNYANLGSTSFNSINWHSAIQRSVCARTRMAAPATIIAHWMSREREESVSQGVPPPFTFQ